MTSFPIFVAVRVMPSSLADPGENVVVKSATEVTIKAPMEGTCSRTVNHAFGPTASFYDLWDNYGQKALDAALRGEHAAIVVYGGTGSGKSYTTARNPNKEDLVQQTIERLAGNADANLTIVAVRNDQIVDLVNPKLDNLKLKGDETSGPTVEGAAVVRLPTASAGAEHVAKCMAARDSFCTAVNSMPQMIFTLYLFSVGTGSITIVECPSTHRTIAPRLSPDQQKESLWRLKAVDQLTRVWLDIAVTADPKAIAWKDNKPLRTLVAAGTQAMEGNKGFLGLVVCAGAGKNALYESMCNVIIAEGAVKLEGLKTVSEYKEAISAYEERAEADAKVGPGLQADAKAAEAEYERVRQENEAKAKELEEKVAHLKSLAPLAKAQADQDVERAKKDAERMKADHIKALAQEMDKLKNITTNSSGLVESESKQKIALVDAEFAARAKAIKDEMAEIEKETEGYKAILKEADALRAESRRKEQEALRPVKDLERDLAKLKKELDLTVATRGKCREDGMAEDDIERMIPVWELRDKLDVEDDALTEVAREVMQLDFTFTRKLGAPTPDTSDASSSDSDSDSSSDSSTDSEELAERARQEQEAKDRAAREKQAKFDRADFEKEFAFVKDCVHKEKYLADLVDKVFAYLEYGTNVSVLTPRGFTRHFFYLTRNRKQVAIVNEVSEGQTPVKKDPARVLPMDTVKSIVMGQHSALYKNFLAKVAGRSDPVRAEPAPPPEELSAINMHRYYYRSFSLQPKNDGDDWFDIVCDTQTDFEAIIIAVAKLTDLDANWGRGLFIDLADRVDDLKSFERKVCEELHLTPKEYFTIKQKTVENPEMLYMTLHDMRLATSMDLYHCQRIMDIFYTQRWVLRRNLKYFRHQEAVEARADAAANRIGGGGGAAAPAAAGAGLSLL